MDPVCQHCALWGREATPHRDESADYRAFRPCRDTLRPRFHGRQALGVTGKVLTAPDAGCAHHLPLEVRA